MTKGEGQGKDWAKEKPERNEELGNKEAKKQRDTKETEQ